MLAKFAGYLMPKIADLAFLVGYGNAHFVFREPGGSEILHGLFRFNFVFYQKSAASLLRCFQLYVHMPLLTGCKAKYRLGR